MVDSGLARERWRGVVGWDEMDPIRIAICDDHPVFRAGIIAVLSTQPDMEVVLEVGRLSELQAGLETTPADLVLLDYELPDAGDLAALPELSRSSKVLVFSAFDDPARVKQAMELGAVGYVLKDAGPKELFRCVREGAAGRTVLDVELASKVARSLRRSPEEAAFRRRVDALTPRQREVLGLLGDGKTAKEIASALSVSEGTAKNHVTRILQLLEVSDRAKLVRLLARYPLDESAPGIDE